MFITDYGFPLPLSPIIDYLCLNRHGYHPGTPPSNILHFYYIFCSLDVEMMQNVRVLMTVLGVHDPYFMFNNNARVKSDFILHQV